ncbi:MAG: 23S rRNA (uracil(1939)-C(5))-methyltransferase RlmD [Clostridia bacterium]|nr:23S rRNA (uracil(1939)-C(5))-methyltransferase RlmD [Clostridia bacterium]
MNCPFAAKGCGGCAGISEKYGDLLRQKEAAFRRLFPQAQPIVGAQEPRCYRNKVLRSFANGKTSLYHGMYRAGTHQIISVNRCLLENEQANGIANTALSILADMGLPAYREDFHRGVLRHMQVRRAHRTGQALVTVITGGDQFPQGEEFAKELMRRCPDVRGVIHNVNPRGDSAVMGSQSRLLAGRDEIWDVMSGLRVCLTSRSFYQVNTVQAEKLYRRAIEMAGLSGGDSALDAYCGVGVIGMLAAKQAGQAMGIEQVPDAVRCAKKAAAYNKIDHISFVCGDTAQALRKGDFAPSVIFMDPPRAGCSRQFLDSAIACAPKRMVYISCNPQTLRRDADILQQSGYCIETVQPFDLFPYTEHVETVLLLSKGEISTKSIRVEFPLDELDTSCLLNDATYPQIKNYVLEHTGLKVSSLYIAQVKAKHGIIERECYNKAKSENTKVPQCPPEKEKAIEDALRYFNLIEPK